MERFARSLFWLQIVLAWAYSVPQAWRLIGNTQSITVTFYLLMFLFILFNLSLSINAFLVDHKESSKRIVWIYANWTLLVGLLLAIVSWKGVWKNTDNIVLILAFVATISVLVIGYKMNLSYRDSIIRGILACIYKGGPQLYLAYCIIQNHGASDLAPLAVWVANSTALLRIYQISFSIRQSGWTRDLLGLVISESGNEITWMLVTVIWLLV